MNVIIEYRPEIRSMFLDPVGMVLSEAYVIVHSEDCSLYETFPATRLGYEQAERFMRLMERGYSPRRALSILDYSYGKGAFEFYFEPLAHDRLTDEIPPFVPVGYTVEFFSIDELATCELDAVFDGWLSDGDEALYLFEDEYLVAREELRRYVTGRAQGEDEIQGSWEISHHTSNYSY